MSPTKKVAGKANRLADKWSRTNLSYISRVANLLSRGGLTGGFALNAETLFDDLDADDLSGDRHNHLYFIGSSGGGGSRTRVP